MSYPNPDEVTSFQKLVEGVLSDTLAQHYPEYKAHYDRFRKHVGLQCAYCKSAARTMYMGEVKRKGDDFLSRLRSGDWSGY